MAIYGILVAFCVALALANVELSLSHVLKGSVSCLDCDSNHDLSGIKVLVKCNQVKKLAMATTQKHGSFEAELPSDSTPTTSSTANSFNCQAKILGGPEHIYTSKKNMMSDIVESQQSAGSFTISKPLKFYKSCPVSKRDQGKYCANTNSKFGSSKTVDFPVPREWGIAPTSYYVPFFPIIGIP